MKNRETISRRVNGRLDPFLTLFDPFFSYKEKSFKKCLQGCD